eukprot:2591626-Rhodomonas_salina.1
MSLYNTTSPFKRRKASPLVRAIQWYQCYHEHAAANTSQYPGTWPPTEFLARKRAKSFSKTTPTTPKREVRDQSRRSSGATALERHSLARFECPARYPQKSSAMAAFQRAVEETVETVMPDPESIMSLPMLERMRLVIENLETLSPIELEAAYLLVTKPFRSHTGDVMILVVPSGPGVKESYTGPITQVVLSSHSMWSTKFSLAFLTCDRRPSSQPLRWL